MKKKRPAKPRPKGVPIKPMELCATCHAKHAPDAPHVQPAPKDIEGTPLEPETPVLGQTERRTFESSIMNDRRKR